MRLFPLLLCLSLAAVAQEEGPLRRGAGSQEPINATTFASLRVRNIGPAFISGRVAQIAVFPDDSSPTRGTTGRPTRTALEQYQIASGELAVEVPKLRKLIETDLKAIEKQLDAAGASYTPGRLPDWKPGK